MAGPAALAPRAAALPQAVAATPAPAPTASLSTLTPDNWGSLAQRLELVGLARQLASNCAYTGRQDALLRFALDPRHQAIRSKSQEDKLAQALSRYFGETLRIEIEVSTPPADTPALAQARRADEQLGAARAGLDRDPTVLALKERFGATLHPESVRLSGAEAGPRTDER